MSMVMTTTGHKALAIAAYQAEYWLALGEVLPGTDITNWRAENQPPQEDKNTLDLIKEVGRRVVTTKQYVEEDAENGTIEANNTKWKISTVPTRNIYLQFKFEAKEAASNVIRQVGIFTGTVRQDNVPSGQYYLTPDQVKEKGALFMYQNLAPIARNLATREVFEYVLTF